MFYNKLEPLEKNSTQVHTTTDYNRFKSVGGNRNKNQLHLMRLRKSMESNYLFTVILVNENYEIIDGQHRFEIIKELNLPLHYVICPSYGLKEVHILNQNAKTWNSTDYISGFCQLGLQEYITFDKFMTKHELPFQIALLLLSGGDSGRYFEQFKSGNFKILDLDFAEKTVEKLHLIGKYYEGYKRRWFVFAIIRLLQKENFEFTELLAKLKIQPTVLQDCTSVAQYIALIEEIYNYRRSSKVNLRF
jgi:hypothetical protein